MSILWKMLGTQKPAIKHKNAKNRQDARQAVQKLWVAGTLGAFFAAFARNLPVHISQFSIPTPDWEYTLEVLLKYSYLLWLLTYFFISNLHNEQQTTTSKEDLFYDFAQSILALGSAFFMGFISSGIACGGLSFVFVNFTIFTICMLALKMFHSGQKDGINAIRSWGVAISVLSILSIFVLCREGCINNLLLFSLLGISQVFLWWLLVAFIKIRILA